MSLNLCFGISDSTILLIEHKIVPNTGMQSKQGNKKKHIKKIWNNKW